MAGDFDPSALGNRGTSKWLVEIMRGGEGESVGGSDRDNPEVKDRMLLYLITSVHFVRFCFKRSGC